MTEYPVIYEQADDGSWSVRAVDLPVFSVGAAPLKKNESIREAIALFLEGGEPPRSVSEVGTVRV